MTAAVPMVWRYGATQFVVRVGGTPSAPGPIVAGPFDAKHEAERERKRLRRSGNLTTAPGTV